MNFGLQVFSFLAAIYTTAYALQLSLEIRFRAADAPSKLTVVHCVERLRPVCHNGLNQLVSKPTLPASIESASLRRRPVGKRPLRRFVGMRQRLSARLNGPADPGGIGPSLERRGLVSGP